MSDLLDETRISLTDLAGDENLNVCTIWRWAKRGVRGVVLETIAVGGRRFTSREAFRRFVQATSAKVVQVSDPATPRKRGAAVRRAEAELATAGI